MGGAEKLMTLLLPQIQQQGHEIDLLLLDGTRTVLYDELKSKGISIYSLGNITNVYHPIYLYRLFRFLRHHHYEVVHTHNTAPQLFGAMAHLVNRKFKLFTTEHSTNNRRRNMKGIARVDRWMYRQYDQVICISDQAEKNLKQHIGQTAQNVMTIYNGVDIAAIANSVSDSSLLPNPRKFIVVMVARMVEAKDQDTLIRAISHLSSDDYQLWLVGDGERRPILENLVQQLQVEDRVKFWGIRTDVPVLLKSSDVVVMSSHWEGLSLSNIEGMAAGKPFVASNVDGIREVTEGAGILFQHENDQELADILQHLKSDTQWYQNIAHRCFERAQKYDISIMAQKYIEQYQRILSY